jgi:hypothetical protein
VLLMASKFVGISFAKALRAALPIYVVFLVTICFTIYFPKVVLWLPKQVIPESVGCFKAPVEAGIPARTNRRPGESRPIPRCAVDRNSRERFALILKDPDLRIRPGL